MTAALVAFSGVVAAAGIALVLRGGSSPQVTVPDAAGPLERELASLREQLEEGELDEAGYQALRERAAARAVARTPSHGEPRRGRVWIWPAAAVAAAAVIGLTIVPALRQRTPNGFITGNDFSASLQAESTGVKEWRLADRAAAQGRLTAAIAHYRLAVAFFPERGDVRAGLGLALARRGATREALTQLRIAARARPPAPEAELYLGAVLLRVGDERGATAAWRRFLVLRPGGPGTAFVRRQLAARSGR